MHNIQYYDYKETTDKKKIQAELDDYVSHETWQEGGGGTGGIRWIDHLCANYDEAEKYIKAHDKGWYDCLAVKYYEPIKEKTKKLDELDLKVKEAYEAYYKKDRELYVKSRTSEFIGCGKCKNRLASKYLQTNFCPVCRSDLRSDTILKSIAAAQNKWKNAQKTREEYIQNHSKKEVRWLVKIEYHT